MDFHDVGVDDILYQQHKVLTQWFPDLKKWMDEVPDPRSFCTYPVASLLSQGMFLFLSKDSSRNMANNRAAQGNFYKENFSRFFEGMEWAHFDTAEDLYRRIDKKDIEEVKAQMVRSLIEKKRITTFRGYYLVAIDATGVTSYDQKLAGAKLTYKTSKNGKTTYLNIVLEAKIVTPEGLSISIASEPLSNEEVEVYQKQDCELKAFKRIAAKIKRMFPRLPVCLLLDGLYSKEPLFSICKSNNWKYITVLKDGCLKSLQEDIKDTAETARIRFESIASVKQGKGVVYAESRYQCIEELQYKDYTVHWIEGVCPKPRVKEGQQVQMNRFVYLTNLPIERKRGESKRIFIKRIVKAGRLRWKIENEGFNTQKHKGYHLHHKFSEKSMEALHVYYILMQMAHIVNQIVEHSKSVVALLKRRRKLTIRYLWDRVRHVLESCLLHHDLLRMNKNRCQIRLAYKTNQLE
ncbi:MAG TPA: hypothetical protein VK102_07445 [Sphingobacterium sp.]|nr:hypothetical protein [Sphingobacterium sp.]